MTTSQDHIPFPPLDSAESPTQTSSPPSPTSPSSTHPATRARHASSKSGRPHAESAASSITYRLRQASRTFEESNPPEGFFAATSALASSVLSVHDTRRPQPVSNASGTTGPKSVLDRSRAQAGEHLPQTPPALTSSNRVASVTTSMHNDNLAGVGGGLGRDDEDSAASALNGSTEPEEKTESSAPLSAVATREDPGERAAMKAADELVLTEPYDNGYHFPPAHSWQQSTKLGLIAFWHYSITPVGFFVVLYGLNVVAWGGMLFLLLCNASPAMCYPTCNDINSPRRKWIEWDSQILNALFCVTGFGLAPWRFRDLYYLLKFRLGKDKQAIRRLAGIHRGWFRLPGSQKLPVHIGPETVTDSLAALPEESIPFPVKSIPNAPLTGIRAPPTALWKMDYVIWLMVLNTFLQCVLSGFMWGMDRYTRPSWSTGLFVALACIVAAIGGLKMFTEGKKVKAIEGVPISEKDLERLEKDKELGIVHYNNIKDKKPKEKEEKGKSTKE